MADNLDDGEFWLPPQFLTDDDDDVSLDNKNNNLTAKNDDVFDAVSRPLFLSSYSSETESDEEEYLAELTRRVELELDLNSAKPKGVFGGGSPQSTLSAFGSSGKGSSPNGAVPHASDSASTWDLLRAAAGEVERMRLTTDDDRYGFNFLKPSPVAAAAAAQPNTVNSNGVVGFGFYSQQQQPSLSHQQFQIAQFEMMRKQQMAKQQQQQRQMVPNRGRNNNNNVVRVGNVGLGLSASEWPPHGYGMRAVFLAGKRERTGTGVFLPRCVDTRNNNESRKKPVCNTVLVPDRVAEALNLNREGVVGGGLLQHQKHQPRFNGENGSAVSRVRNNNHHHHHHGFSHSHQKRNNMKPLQQQPQVVNHEIQLPQEWTY